LGSIVGRTRPDLLHIDEEPYNLATYQAMCLARRLSIPACFFSWQNLKRRYPPPFRWIEAYSYRHAALAIAGSNDARKVLRSKGFSGPVSVIPQFGVDPEIFKPLDADRRFPEDSTVFGFAGGLVEGKGVDLLLRGLSGIADHQWQARIAGTGSEESSLRRLAATLGIGDRVTFVGRVRPSSMPQFYRSLDVLVLPSRSLPNWTEQFGRVLVEAMACGIAVVGSDSGEIPHVIGDAGLVFAEGDENALRACLRQLMKEEVRFRFGKRGRERVRREFTQYQVAARTAEAYRHMLPER
jgi:glycosyltransferase involved in cell wall biosynthesis